MAPSDTSMFMSSAFFPSCCANILSCCSDAPENWFSSLPCR